MGSSPNNRLLKLVNPVSNLVNLVDDPVNPVNNMVNPVNDLVNRVIDQKSWTERKAPRISYSFILNS